MNVVKSIGYTIYWVNTTSMNDANMNIVVMNFLMENFN